MFLILTMTRSISIRELFCPLLEGRRKQLESYDKALKINSNNVIVWNNKMVFYYQIPEGKKKL